MRNFAIFILTIFIFSCNISQNLLNKGEYEQAVRIAVRKLQRNKNNEKQIKVLEQAYPKAVQKIIEQINFLNKEGRPDRWDEIYHLYLKLDELQSLVETVTPLTYKNGRTITFKHTDYSTKIISAKRKAAQYYYAHAKKLMQQNDKFAYRQAYYELKKAKEYNPSYLDADSLMKICYDKGQTNIILIAQNSTFYKLSDDFMINLLNLPLEQLNSTWIKYYSTDVRNGNYDISIYIILKIIDVSADQLDEKTKIYTKQIEDGYEYKTDKNGNILKDSTGKPIKVVKYKTIKCQLREFRQFKIAHISGEIQYINNHTDQIILQHPIAADHIFEHYYYIANGDLDALPPSKRKLLNSKPIPYPHPLDMIYAANETLKRVIFNALLDNKDFIEENF